MKNSELNNTIVINRLTALWALNECGLGGLMHAFRSPFTGIIVGGLSILLITLIATHSKKIPTTILKSLSIVLLVKLSVSPHSPLPAYLAVSFQGLLGIVLYRLLSITTISVVLFGILTFMESALQKVVTLTLIYGQSLWEALDNYIDWVGQKLNFVSVDLSSKHLILSYLFLYTISGLLTGILISKTCKIIRSIQVPENLNSVIKFNSSSHSSNQKQRKKKFSLVWIAIIVIILISLYGLDSSNNSIGKGIYIIIRSLTVIGLWYFLVGPLLFRILEGYLKKKSRHYETDIANTLTILPYLKSILNYTWQESSKFSGIGRIQYFVSRSIVYSIHINIPNQ